MIRSGDILDRIAKAEPETPILDHVDSLDLPVIVMRRVIDWIAHGFGTDRTILVAGISRSDFPKRNAVRAFACSSV